MWQGLGLAWLCRPSQDFVVFLRYLIQATMLTMVARLNCWICFRSSCRPPMTQLNASSSFPWGPRFFRLSTLPQGPEHCYQWVQGVPLLTGGEGSHSHRSQPSRHPSDNLKQYCSAFSCNICRLIHLIVDKIIYLTLKLKLNCPKHIFRQIPTAQHISCRYWYKTWVGRR